jgi:twitching motility protein PilT
MDIELLNEFFAQAIEAEASDIHLKPGQPPVYRLDSVLYKAEAEDITTDDMWELINEILPPGLKDQFDQTQQVDFAWNYRPEMRFRVNLFASKAEPTMALRYVKNNVANFHDLHLPEQLAKIVKSRSGIIILGGTTGSGKSTTLASMLQYLNENAFRRIITIEDPIEYIFKDDKSMISQREVGFDTADFMVGLKSAMRQDPDVIMIGEIRDRDSVETAMAAAETGHLILTTVHTDTAATSISRILDMFPSNERNQIRTALSQTIKAVICQRLVPDVEGRVRPAVEIMVDSPIVKKMIRSEETDKLPAAIESGGEDGMQNFNQALFQMFTDGAITEEIALQYATNVESMKMNLKGIFLDTSNRIVGS